MTNKWFLSVCAMFFMFQMECSGVFRIGIPGDRTGGADDAVFDAVIAELALLRPDIIINVGDLIEGPQPDAAAIHREWDHVMASLAPLKCPIFYVAGNNDIFDDTSRQLFTERTGKLPEYAFRHENVHFLILDNSQMRNWDTLTPERLAWIRSALADARDSDFSCVFFHKPFWLENTFAGQPDALHSVFVEYGVDYVFSGHHHQYTAEERDGVHYVMIGSSGGHIGDNPYRGEYYHYAWLTVDSDGLHLAVMTPGSIRTEDWLTLSDRTEQDILENCLIGTPRTIMGKGDKTAIRLDFQSGCSIETGRYEWDCSGTDWLISPVSGHLNLATGAQNVHCAAWLRGSRYPAPRLVVSTDLPHGEYQLYRTLQTGLKIDIPRTHDVPSMDGVLSETAWRNSALVEGFGDQNGGSCPSDPVEVKVLCHEGNLYFGITVTGQRDAENQFKEAPPRDSPVFMMDCVYLMFWTKDVPSRLSQIVLSDRGGILDQQGWWDSAKPGRPKMDAGWNASLTVGWQGDEAGWVAEMSVPLSELGIQKDDVFHFNAYRYQPSKDAFSSWIAPATFNSADAGIMTITGVGDVGE
jgi:predicted phosphodiesterase